MPGSLAAILDYVGEQNNLSGLQQWQQAGGLSADPDLKNLAQLAPRAYAQIMPSMLQKQLEGKAIQDYYGGEQQPTQNQPAQPSLLDAATAQPDNGQSGINWNPEPQGPPQAPIDATALSQYAPQTPPPQNNLAKYAALANLPPALQSVAAQQMMFGGMGFGNTTETGAPTQDVHGDAYLATLNPQIATQVKGLAEGKIPFPSSFALKSPYWQQMVGAVTQYDPSFDAVNYQARAKTRQDFTAGKSAQTINALNTVAQHVAALKEAADALNNGDYPAVNAVANWYGQQTGDDAKTNYDNIVGHVSEELTKAYRGAGGNEADIAREINNLSSSASPKQFKGSFEKIGELLQGKIDAMSEQYKQGMGITAEGLNFYSPKAQQAFQKIGVDVSPQSGGQSALQQAADPLEGKIAVNPSNGTKIIRQGGKWMPYK